MKEAFRKKIERRVRITDEVWDDIEKDCGIMYLKKKDVLINYSDIDKNLYFINSGSFEMSLVSGNGDSKTVWFFLDTIFNVVGVMDSIMFNEPTKYEITALEDATVIKFNFYTAESWMEKYPQLSEFARKDILHDFIESSEIRHHMTSHPPHQFIEYLKHKYPEILERIPAKNIAEFMGITPEWFSKIKNK